jgi:hypothetical protein
VYGAVITPLRCGDLIAGSSQRSSSLLTGWHGCRDWKEAR